MSDRKIIKGSVCYHERMTLLPNAGIHIFLEDVVRMDVSSDVIATTSFTPRGGPPWAFSFSYDPENFTIEGDMYCVRELRQMDNYSASTLGKSPHSTGKLARR